MSLEFVNGNQNHNCQQNCLNTLSLLFGYAYNIEAFKINKYNKQNNCDFMTNYNFKQIIFNNFHRNKEIQINVFQNTTK